MGRFSRRWVVNGNFQVLAEAGQHVGLSGVEGHRVDVAQKQALRGEFTTVGRVLRASPDGASMGLLHDSTIVADVLVTVEDREVAKVIGTCLPTAMTLVDDALRATMDL